MKHLIWIVFIYSSIGTFACTLDDKREAVEYFKQVNPTATILRIK